MISEAKERVNRGREKEKIRNKSLKFLTHSLSLQFRLFFLSLHRTNTTSLSLSSFQLDDSSPTLSLSHRAMTKDFS
ncbi:hypothetical protein RJT34_24583 [Clitoria ternatea]|uniref:Uncharacterized protein n=1 Tax=Clitoria ternatea TaxID=43366 RepID=A0AAN9FNI3_CLITE